MTNKKAVANIPKQMGKYIPYMKQTTTKKLSRQTRILRNKTYETPAILAKEGIEVSIITDHDVIPIEHLPLCAALAHKAGLSYYDSLKAITINPAKALGIEDRVGSIRKGKDADMPDSE